MPPRPFPPSGRLTANHTLDEVLEEVPVPRAPTTPWWFWTTVLLLVSGVCGWAWLNGLWNGMQAALAPYTFIGNSLFMVPYDWYLPAYVQDHAAWVGIAAATGATVLVEFWNMDILARLLSREGSRTFRSHRVTARFLRWYRIAPWWTKVASAALPIIPFYPCRFLATLARYPLWRYQTAIIVGRSARYAGLAGLGVLLNIPPVYYFLLGLTLLVLFGLKHLQLRLREPARPA